MGTATVTAAMLPKVRLESLKPCPFCGSKAEKVYTAEKYYITCTNPQCRCRTGLYRKQQAFIRWNRRYDD